MLSLLPSAVALGLAAFIALMITVRRQSPASNTDQRRIASRALLVAVAIQCLHFAEEAVTGFHVQFPALFGLPPIPLGLFVVFNLVLIVIWIVAIDGLRSNRPVAFFAAWFLAITAILNGIAHALMAIAANGYFPGLLTSPFIGGAGIWLWLRLRAATRI